MVLEGGSGAIIVDRVGHVEDSGEWRGSISLSGVGMNGGQVASGQINNICDLHL